MKTVNIISFLSLATLLSCNTSVESNSSQEKIEVYKTIVPSNLTGKVYQSSDGMDSLCKRIEKGTDHYQRLLFINDSMFVKTVSTCCGDDFDTTYMAFEWYYSGVYKMDDKQLNLYYNPHQVVFYMKQDNAALTYLKIEKSDMTNTKLERANCNSIPYFKQTDNEWNGRLEFVCPTEDALGNFKKDFIDRGIWDKVFQKDVKPE